MLALKNVDPKSFGPPYNLDLKKYLNQKISIPTKFETPKFLSQFFLISNKCLSPYKPRPPNNVHPENVKPKIILIYRTN